MYNGVKVLDVHGHVSSPEATSNYLMLMMAANTAFPNPLQPGGRATPGLSPEDFQRASKRHVDYMDERNIDLPEVMNPGTPEAFNLRLVHGHVGEQRRNLRPNLHNLDHPFAKAL